MADQTSRLSLALAVAFSLHAATAWAGSPFAGDWSGPWRGARGQSGIFSLHIDPVGVVSGKVTNGAMTGKVWGQISEAGDLNANYKYWIVSYHATAHLTLRGDHLTGIARYTMPMGIPLDSGPIDLARH